jgi:hypothetical protein
MKPRGERIACSLETEDGVTGVYSVYAGTEPKSIAKIDTVEWGKVMPKGDVKVGMFSVIGDMGYTGQIIRVTGEELRAMIRTKLINDFYVAVLWGGGPLKIAKDAVLMARRASATPA